ncbi:Mss4-like protein [Podospora australis]|uniref:Mss4-like protein n=1 Tax=Podospora australis TaxID=1536484 RepID=A0AAN6WYA9_9PEZI|nr:Mss4-like protein [Podospora australis]
MSAQDQPQQQQQDEEEETYEAGCHCGYIKFAVTLSPPLSQGHKVMECNCSMCRRAGYLLVYPPKAKVTWHNSSRERCATYQFNTKQKDQLFCGKCGASIGIDFRHVLTPEQYGISVRTFNNIDLTKLTYRKGNGVEKVPPNEDLSGTQWEIDEAERQKEAEGKL